MPLLIVGVASKTFLGFEADDVHFIWQIAGASDFGSPVWPKTQHKLTRIMAQSRKNDLFELLEVGLAAFAHID